MTPCCGGHGAAIIAAKQAMGDLPKDPPLPSNGLVKMMFIGKQKGEIGFWVNGKEYEGADNETSKYVFARPGDVEKLERTMKWQRV